MPTPLELFTTYNPYPGIGTQFSAGMDYIIDHKLRRGYFYLVGVTNMNPSPGIGVKLTISMKGSIANVIKEEVDPDPTIGNRIYNTTELMPVTLKWRAEGKY